MKLPLKTHYSVKYNTIIIIVLYLGRGIPVNFSQKIDTFWSVFHQAAKTAWNSNSLAGKFDNVQPPNIIIMQHANNYLGQTSRWDCLFNPIRTGVGGSFLPPRVNLMSFFGGWSKNFQLLMVFQVETFINFWWSQIFGLLWNLFQNWASERPSHPDFRAKNAFFHFFCQFFALQSIFFLHEFEFYIKLSFFWGI